MKKSFALGLIAAFLGLCFLASCGDTDELMSENILGYWKGPFVNAEYASDSTTVIYSSTDSNTVVHFYYPYIIIRGKSGIGTRFAHYGDTDSINFNWEVKYNKLYLTFPDTLLPGIEISHYNEPIGDTFEGKVDTVEFKLKKMW